MAKRILLIEGDPQIVELTRDPLEDQGYLVVTARDGSEGLKLTRKEQPDLVMVDFDLPGMKGNVVASRLRRDPATDHIAILMIIDEDQLEDVEIGRGGSADDFLIKPFSTLDLITKINPLLVSDDDLEGTVVSTGNGELDSKMGGGVPMGSLTLIEGDSGAGKSVLSQQMMHGCLVNGYRLAIFSSENTVKSLVKQMQSLNLDIKDYLLLSRLRVFPIETSRLGGDAPSVLTRAIKKEEKGRDIIFVDSLTPLIPDSSEPEVMTFFEECKKLCSHGTTIAIVVHSHGLTSELLTRLRSLCDAHLQLRTEEAGNKLVKTMEVTKIRGAEQQTGNIISFEVEPGWGMRVIPVNKVKG
jgi:flagellar protein FlaH